MVECLAGALEAMEQHAELAAVIRDFCFHFAESNPGNPASQDLLAEGRKLRQVAADLLATYRRALGADVYEMRQAEKARQAANKLRRGAA